MLRLNKYVQALCILLLMTSLNFNTAMSVGGRRSIAPVCLTWLNKLIATVRDGNPERIQDLFIDARNAGMTPEQICDMLTHTSQSGNTALTLAAARWHDDTNVVKALLAAARNTGIKSEQILTMLMNADRSGYTALICAVHTGRIEVIQTLFTAACDAGMSSEQMCTMLTHANKYDNTALKLAAFTGRINILQALINGSRNAGMNAKQRHAMLTHTDKKGYSALMIATLNGKSRAAAALLLAAENVEITDETVDAVMDGTHQWQSDSDVSNAVINQQYQCDRAVEHIQQT